MDSSLESKRAFLDAELKINRPFLVNHSETGVEARHVVESLQVVSDHINKYSPRSIGKLIISMTRNTEDLLTVYLFMREVGMAVKNSPRLEKNMVSSFVFFMAPAEVSVVGQARRTGLLKPCLKVPSTGNYG